MRVRELGTRVAPASIRGLILRVGQRQATAGIPVQRRQIPYWQERGWTRQDNAYTGSFQTPFGAFQGWIEQERSGQINFYLYRPSEEIRRHSHFTCFQHRGSDWYLVHMAKRPKDVSSGIMTIERLIREAYRS